MGISGEGMSSPYSFAPSSSPSKPSFLLRSSFRPTSSPTIRTKITRIASSDAEKVKSELMMRDIFE